MTSLEDIHDSAAQPPTVTTGEREVHRLLVPVLVTVGMVVALISALGSPMVPMIADEYGVDLASAQWSLTITLLAGAVFTPVLGRLADGPYRREVILSTLLVIVVGSVVAAVPDVFALLLLGRALQGVGFGLMAMAMAVARDHLPLDRVPATVATLSITAASGVGIGYPLSGYLAQRYGLHAPFLLAAALATAALAGSWRTLPTALHRPYAPLDIRGAALLAAAVSSVVVALSELDEWGIGSPITLVLLAASVVALFAWVRLELRIDRPLVDLRVLRHAPVRVAHGSAVLAGTGMYFLIAVGIRFVQTPTSTGYGPGRSVLVAGFMLVPFSLGTIVISRFTPALRRRPGVHWMMPLGAGVLAAAVALFGVLRSELWHLHLVMALTGVGIAIVWAITPVLIVSVVPPEETGSALGFNQVLRTVGASIGSAGSAAVLAAYTPASNAFPVSWGYTMSSAVGLAVWLLLIGLGWPRAATRAAA